MAPNRIVHLALLLALLAAAPARPGGVASAIGEGRVLVVPLNLGIEAADPLLPGMAPVWRELAAHFARSGRPVATLDPHSAVALWGELRSEADGRGARPGLYEVYALFARSLGEQIDFDAVVFPSLVLRAAQVSEGAAHWDGVRRELERDTGAPPFELLSGGLLERRSGRRDLAAASLHVAVLGPDGRRRFEGAGGLVLLQQPGVLDPALPARDLPGEDAFADTAALREGIATALVRPLPASPPAP